MSDYEVKMVMKRFKAPDPKMSFEVGILFAAFGEEDHLWDFLCVFLVLFSEN